MIDSGRSWVEAMRRGDYRAAWAVSDAVLAGRDAATRDDPAEPYHRRWVWDGRPVDGKDVLVRCYHGLGDTIQFARYLPALAERARSVTLEVQPRLARLLSGMRGVKRLIPFDAAQPAPPSACDIEIMELPHALRLPPDIARAPYLTADPALLPSDTVALCYASGDWDAERSIPPARLARIAAHYTASTLVSEPTTLAVLNPDGCPFDMDATAALVAGAALVITVDTMVAHLAGALGRPTWLLLRREPDWRWPAAGNRTPWYPSMRLYHQSTAGDWTGVIDRVEADLARVFRAGLPTAERG